MIAIEPKATLLPINQLTTLNKIYVAYSQCINWEPEWNPSYMTAQEFIRKRMQGCHESPLEHASATFQITCSRACSHQLVRHRLASYSQVSQRYCVEKKDIKVVVPSDCKATPEQGEIFGAAVNQAYLKYLQLIDQGVDPEDARFALPNATATRLIVTMNFRELLHFFGERCCHRAQWEIRSLAEQMLAQMCNLFPCIFENTGPKCLKLKRCPEEKSCGFYKEKE